MKKRWIILIYITIFIISCAPPQQNQDTDIVAAQADDLTVPKPADCGINFLKPEIISPHQVIVDTSSPTTFKWNMDCIPSFAELEVRRFGDPSLSLFVVNVLNLSGEYTINLPSEPAVSYFWTVLVRNKNNDEEISNMGVFTTGPLCTAEELIAPTLVSPADGTVDSGKGWGILKEVHTILKYPVNGCTPEYFESDLSLNEDFSGDDNWNIGGPGNVGTIEGQWKNFEDDTNELQNCSLYYWRARAVVGTDYSDWSEAFTFFLDVYGNCYTFPEFKGIQNANCRRDPWAGENYVGVIWEGDTAELLGLNEDASWGMFKLKNELECWVNMDLVEPDPLDAVFFPGFYPVIEHDEQPEGAPAPAPADEASDEETPTGCMVPSGRSGSLVCEIPCPNPEYAARVCP